MEEIKNIQSRWDLAWSLYDEEKYEEAFKVFYQLAEGEGDAKAMYCIANMYYEGKGVKKDLKSAFAFYKKSAKLNFSAAQFDLGKLYFYGDGVEKNMVKAAELFKKAADQGLAEAMRDLALCYQYGIGVRRDIAKARETFAKAAGADGQETLPNAVVVHGKDLAAALLFKQAAVHFKFERRRFGVDVVIVFVKLLAGIAEPFHDIPDVAHARGVTENVVV